MNLWHNYLTELWDESLIKNKVFKKVGNIVFFWEKCNQKVFFIRLCDYLIWSCVWVMCLVLGSENLPLLHFFE